MSLNPVEQYIHERLIEALPWHLTHCRVCGEENHDGDCRPREAKPLRGLIHLLA